MFRKLIVSSLVVAIAFTTTACSRFVSDASSDPSGSDAQFETVSSQLDISRTPSGQERWGTFCEAIIGEGWSCLVDVVVENTADTAWGEGDYLKANLISEEGAASTSSSYYPKPELTGTFFGPLNPGQKKEWIIYFAVGADQLFNSVEITNLMGEVVSTVPVCMGSSEAYSLGC